MTFIGVDVTGGLSPLARGTHSCAGVFPLGARFIPAGAGNTRMNGRACGPNSVYPRWRGEHGASGIDTAALRGLSPLARGTL